MNKALQRSQTQIPLLALLPTRLSTHLPLFYSFGILSHSHSYGRKNTFNNMQTAQIRCCKSYCAAHKSHKVPQGPPPNYYLSILPASPAAAGYVIHYGWYGGGNGRLPGRERERWLRGFISPFISPITPSLGGGIVTQQSLSKHRGWKKAATEVRCFVEICEESFSFHAV